MRGISELIFNENRRIMWRQKPSTMFTSVFIFIMLTVFPLFLKNYTNVTLMKLMFLIVLIAALISVLFLFPDKSTKGAEESGKRRKIPLTVKLFFVYFGVCFLSLVVSPYFPKSELAALFSGKDFAENLKSVMKIFIGHGRYDGIAIFLLLGIVFVACALYGRLRMFHLHGLSAALLVMSLIGILQMSGYDIFKLGGAGVNFKFDAFLSTIGNVDILSGFLCPAIACVVGGYIFLEPKRFRPLYLLAAAAGIYVQIQVDVSLGRIGLIAAAMLLIPLAAANIRTAYYGLDMAAAVFAATAFSAAVNYSWNESVQHMNTVVRLGNTAALLLLAAVISVGVKLFLKARILRGGVPGENLRYHKKRIIAVYIAELAIIAAAAVFFRYGYTVGNKENLLNYAAKFFQGKLSIWDGSHRIAIWQSSELIFKKYPILGSGYGTFKTAFIDISAETYRQLTNKGTVVDFAHNDYLNILCTTGIIGAASYAAFLAVTAVGAVKNAVKNPRVIVLSGGVAAFLAQVFFNINIISVTPVFWLLIGMLCFEITHSEPTEPDELFEKINEDIEV